MTQQTELTVRGRSVRVNTVRVGQRLVTITGRVIREARIWNEWYADVGDPTEVIEALRRTSSRVDLFTFVQRPPDLEPRYAFHLEREGIAALRVTTHDVWWRDQISSEARRKVRKANKTGVVVREVPFGEDLLRGIVRIYNEAPIKRGKPFWHYGKDLAAVETQMGVDLENATFIGAYYEGQLIGFVKLLYAGKLASPVVNLSMMAHRDKAPSNALMAKMVEICSDRQISFLFYGIWNTRRGGMRDFLTSNGFAELQVPRYYVPLNSLGRAALRLGLHKGIKEVLPEWVYERLLAIRARWYQGSFGPSGHAAGSTSSAEN